MNQNKKLDQLKQKLDSFHPLPPEILSNLHEDLVKGNEPLSEWQIKSIHQLILRNIDDKNATISLTNTGCPF